MNSVEHKLRTFGGRACRPTASKAIYRSLLAVVSLAAVSLAGFMFTSAARGQQAQTDADSQLSSAQLAERTLHRRAVEAVIWGVPLVNTDAMRQAYFRDVGARYNDICYFSTPADWHFQVTTPNASTNYVYFNFNLKDGPVVVEIPAAVGAGLLGSMVDAWDTPMADIGPAGEDQGKGGKYLLLPPDFKGEPPSGFFTLRYPTYNGYALYRAIRAGSTAADVAASLALVKKLRVYPLAQQASPPEQRFIDIHGKTFDGIANFDERFFESLNRMVQEEPVQRRDLVAMGMLKSIGIEKGKEFKPDAAMQRILKAGAQEAQAQFIDGLTSYSQPWWPDRSWSPPDARGVKTGFTYQTADALDVDPRGWANFAAFAMPKKTGESLVYLFTFRDGRGERLSGERTYMLRVPANVPAKQYWSMIVYDVHTAAFIREAPVVTLDSYNQEMKRNADGSVDIYFGPKAPAGKETNWIYTAPGKAFFPAMRFYDPDKPLFDKTWKLPDIEQTENFTSTPTATSQDVSDQEAYEIVKDAYVYAYPLLLSDLTLRQQTNFAEPTGKLAQAPLNQFSHATEFTPPDWRVVVRPNVDTLYSPATLDLGPEPVVLSVPATDRYFVLPMMSLWTDIFAVPGTRTTGRNTARDFLLVGPNWRGEAPAGLELIRSPTRIMNIGGRTQTNGVADYENVHKIQRGYKLTPLSAWGKGEYVPPKGKVDPTIDMKTPPPAQVDTMDAAAFFARFAELLKDNPPQACDYPMIHRLERIGFKVGQSFDLNTAPPAIKQAFERATSDGRSLVATLGKKAAGEGGKGWVYSTSGGAYGVDYRWRAAIAYALLGENLPQDAVYPSLSMDSDGKPLDGSNAYILQFDKGQLPPVDAFWSVTAYDTDGYFIPNALKRQALGDRDKLQFNPDGSLDLHIRADSPGPDKETNWLPVAKAPFTLLMRLYSPKVEILNGSWTPPPVMRVK